MSRILMVGLPSAGKSTFLAALWHVVTSGEVPEALQQGRLSESREYIESLRRRWQRCDPIQRTFGSTRETVEMQVKNADTGRTADLHFPDLAGEIFAEHWRDRRWMPDYAKQASGAASLLLFVHAGGKYKPDLLQDFPILTPEDATEDELTPLKFDMDRACDQAKIVDILQFHRDYLAATKPLRVAVLVSAWDIAEQAAAYTGESVTPRQFIASHAPLLDQFLRSNPETIENCIWGVSAQGGTLENSADKERQANTEVASHRIHVIPADGGTAETPSHDITAPVRWAAAL